MRRNRSARPLDRYLGSDEHAILVTRQHPFALVRAAFDTLGAATGAGGMGFFLPLLLVLLLGGAVGYRLKRRRAGSS